MDGTFEEELKARRARIVKALGEAKADGKKADALLLFSSPVHLRNGDVEHSYRQHSDFYYLTGFDEPECAMLLSADAPGFVLFVRAKDREKETWEGRRAGLEGARADYGADEAHSIQHLEEKLADYLEDRRRLHYLIGEEEVWDRQVVKTLAKVRSRRRKRVAPPRELVDARELVHEARVFKSEWEQERMRSVARTSAEAHLRAMKECHPGMREWELQDVVENEFRRQGSRRVAYDSIVGSGVNATILHYRENASVMKDGELVLIDAGAEKDYLSADITRTFPVGGKFSEVQARLYQLVLDAQEAAIAMTVPGKSMDDVHQAASDVIEAGLEKEGLMEGISPTDRAARKKRVSSFFMHKTSHYLGMDVHDVGTYFLEGGVRPLAAGMVITVEPGLYFSPDDESVPEAFRGIGIRIEDDVIVTKGAPEVMTGDVPKTVEEIERACRR